MSICPLCVVAQGQSCHRCAREALSGLEGREGGGEREIQRVYVRTEKVLVPALIPKPTLFVDTPGIAGGASSILTLFNTPPVRCCRGHIPDIKREREREIFRM